MQHWSDATSGQPTPTMGEALQRCRLLSVEQRAKVIDFLETSHTANTPLITQLAEQQRSQGAHRRRASTLTNTISTIQTTLSSSQQQRRAQPIPSQPGQHEDSFANQAAVPENETEAAAPAVPGATGHSVQHALSPGREPAWALPPPLFLPSQTGPGMECTATAARVHPASPGRERLPLTFAPLLLGNGPEGIAQLHGPGLAVRPVHQTSLPKLHKSLLKPEHANSQALRRGPMVSSSSTMQFPTAGHKYPNCHCKL